LLWLQFFSLFLQLHILNHACSLLGSERRLSYSLPNLIGSLNSAFALFIFIIGCLKIDGIDKKDNRESVIINFKNDSVLEINKKEVDYSKMTFLYD